MVNQGKPPFDVADGTGKEVDRAAATAGSTGQAGKAMRNLGVVDRSGRVKYCMSREELGDIS